MSFYRKGLFPFFGCLYTLFVFFSALPAFAIECYQCHGKKINDTSGDYRPVDAQFRNVTTGGFQGNHLKHMDPSATPSTCSICHPGSASYGTDHRNGIISISSNINQSPLAAVYRNGSTTFQQKSAARLGACSNVNCHFESITPDWGSAPFASPGDCNRCHTLPPTDTSHALHDNRLGSGPASCGSCHRDHAASSAPFSHATSAGRRAIVIKNFSYSKSDNISYPGYLPSQKRVDERNGSCSSITCHGDTSATWGAAGACLDCHSRRQGPRAAITGQFGANSHHVQGEITNAHCYQCHWEANSDGSINSEFHLGAKVSGAPVRLVVYGAGARPASYLEGVTGVTYTSDGSRGEISKVTVHCVGCHSDLNNGTQPFGDGKTPKQYAWDGTSVSARYNQTGSTVWGKYSTINGANKKVVKAYSAHANASINSRGWETSTGVDGTIQNSSGSISVQCFDCHNSHGSGVQGITSRYASATVNGGIFKDTSAGECGYAVSYKPGPGGAPETKNSRNPGASLCLDCHLNQSDATTPWGYGTTFGANRAILGYWDSPKYKNFTSFGPAERYPFKKARSMMGGHFGASSPLASIPQSPIDGLCTPCHDPHGVSPTLGSKQQYAVPLLKGTWLTSTYKEDTPPENNTHFTNRKDLGYEGVPYHIDQNTFGSDIINPVSGITEAGGTSPQDSLMAGLCLGCHPKDSLTDGVTHDWKSKNRIHEAVKGWKTANGTIQHNYSCSKCHAPHNNTNLPRLMVTNCLDSKHKGRSSFNPEAITGDSGNGSYNFNGPNYCEGAALEFGRWWSSDNSSWCMSLIGTGAMWGRGEGGIPGSWGGRKPGFQGYTVGCHENESSDQSWNAVTQWEVAQSSPPAAPVIGAAAPLADSVIRWAFNSSAQDKNGFRIHDANDAVKVTTKNPGARFLDEGSLAPNTLYSRHVHAYNTAGESAASAEAGGYSLAVAPSISDNMAGLTWLNRTNSVTFTNTAGTGFGPGGVAYYRYVWDQNTEYSFTGSEPQWSSGTLERQCSSDGNWNLHLRSYNAADVASGDHVFIYPCDITDPVATILTPENGSTVAVNNTLTLSVTDSLSGVDWATFVITLTGNKGYSRTYAYGQSPQVAVSGPNVTVTPDTPFGQDEQITASVSVKDAAGNAMTPKTWSFTANSNYPAAPTMTGAYLDYTGGTRIWWNFNDNSNNETGFVIHDENDSVISYLGPNQTSYLEYAQQPNTSYTRHIHAYNYYGISPASASVSIYSRPANPNVTADKSASTWYNSYAPVTFTNEAGWGPGKLTYYRTVWDQKSTYAGNGYETRWDHGTLTQTPNADGVWYMHVYSYGPEGAGSQSNQDLGPFYYDTNPPAGLANAGPANGSTGMAATTAMTAATATDSISGGVQYFFQISTDSNFTQGVQSSGWQTGTTYAPPLAPGTTWFWRVKARDAALNETAYTAAWSFSTAGYPAAPTMLMPLPLTNSIQWNFTDLASNETGFALHDPAQAIKGTLAGENFSSISESGLTPNTPYTRHIHAVNGAGESVASAEITRYTLSLPPDVQSDKTAETWINSPIISFTPKAGTPFGVGGVAYYRVWQTQTPTYTFTDTEGQWNIYTYQAYCPSGSSCWVHFKSYNADDVANGTMTYGPFKVDTVAPTGLAADTPVNGSFNQPLSSPLKCIAASDTLSGSVQYFFQLATDSGFTQGVQNSVWQTGTSFSPTSLAVATTYYWRVKARDVAGNETAYTPVWSFTTVATWTTKGDFEANLNTVGSVTTRNQVQVSGTLATDNAAVTLVSTRYSTIAASDRLTMVVKPDGTVWHVGRDNIGYTRVPPVQVAGVSGIVSIAAGTQHSVALKNDGTVWIWGQNGFGQLGNGSASGSSATPVQMLSLSGVTAISANNSYHTLALKSDGSVWSWGANSSGQVGDGSTNTRTTPYQIPGLSGIVAIATSSYTSMALKSDGTIWTWGENSSYQLGDGTNIRRTSPVQIPTFTGVVAIASSLALKADGTVWTWDYYNRVPVQVAGLTGVTAIASGGHFMVIKSDGTLWTWGPNVQGQLGNGTTTSTTTPGQVTTLSGVTAISAGYDHSVAVANGSLWVWGENWNGQVGDGSYDNRLLPTKNSYITAVKSQIVYSSAGSISNLKINAAAQASWGSLYWNGAAPTNTSIKFRTRGATTEAGLTSATWSGYYLTSGVAISTAPSQWLETELTLQTTDSSVTPTLNDCTVTFVP